mgnify:CR=1 FL=1
MVFRESTLIAILTLSRLKLELEVEVYSYFGEKIRLEKVPPECNLRIF